MDTQDVAPQIHGNVTLRPTKNRIVVELIKPETERKTAGGLWIPQAAAQPEGDIERGRVIAVGPGRRDEDGVRQAVDIQVGDVVQYIGFNAHEFQQDGRSFLILREDQVLGVERPSGD